MAKQQVFRLALAMTLLVVSTAQHSTVSAHQNASYSPGPTLAELAARSTIGGTYSVHQLFIPLFAAPAAKSNKRYWETHDFKGGTADGVTRITTASGARLVLDTSHLKQGYDSAGRYHRGTYYFGRYTLPEHPVAFTQAIASWQAQTPQGTWIEVELRAKNNGAWSKWYSMGAWHQHATPFKRHSFTGQGDTNGDVWVDTLVTKRAASAVQARVTLFTTGRTLTPTINAIGIALSDGHDGAQAGAPTGLTSNLPVPKRSQMVYPGGGEVWCSPTSTSMVMAYWASVTGNQALTQSVPTVKDGVWDYVYQGGGNWPFNTAYAAAHGLEAKVVRLDTLAEVERWTAAGVPVIASISYGRGELTNSPIPSSDGHILVIRGFDGAGNVLTNDPAAPSDAQVGITYKRAEFAKAWGNSNGTVYLIYPRGWKIPESYGHW